MLVLGEKAVQILSGRPDQLESFRGKEHHFAGISAFATYHPAQLLVNTSLKHGAWNDVQLLRRKYDELVGDKPSLA
jgi:DNA polymerase